MSMDERRAAVMKHLTAPADYPDQPAWAENLSDILNLHGCDWA
jgi:hypothetical protein